MELATCARPYARAAFEYSKNSGLLDQWDSMLFAGSWLVSDGRVLGEVSKPEVTVEESVKIFMALGEGVFSKDMECFIQILVEYRRVLIFPEIYRLFRNMKYEFENKCVVDVTTTVILSKTQEELIKTKMRKRLGREVELKMQINKSIIGGVVLRVGDTVIDGSIRTRLANLTHGMKS